MTYRPDTIEVRRTKTGSWNVGHQKALDEDMRRASFTAGDYPNAVRYAFGMAAKWSLLIKHPMRLVGTSTYTDKVFIISTTEEV